MIGFYGEIIHVVTISKLIQYESKTEIHFRYNLKCKCSIISFCLILQNSNKMNKLSTFNFG